MKWLFNTEYEIELEVEKTILEDCLLIKPKRFRDDRGYFSEAYNKERYAEALPLSSDFVQDNISVSQRGTLRGMHFQKPPYAQAKLVQVIRGEVQDVVVDLRPDSPTFKQYFSLVLSEENGYQLYIPKGFAHGFLALSDEVIFHYKCDAYYHPEAEAGIIYNDPSLNIEWELEEDELILSDKDKELPTLIEYLNANR